MPTVSTVFASLAEALLKETQNVFGSRLVSVAIYGSVGRGTARPDSDLDVLLVVRDLSKERLARMAELEALEYGMTGAFAAARTQGIQSCLSPVVKSPERLAAGTPLLFDMVEDAKILLDRDGFLAGVLAKMRHRMQELGSQRIWRGSRWYWVLAPGHKPGEEIEF